MGTVGVAKTSFEKIISEVSPCGTCITSRVEDDLFFWNGILHILPAFRKDLYSIIQNGATTLFWKDNWVKERAPADIWAHVYQLSQHKEESITEITSRMAMIPDPLMTCLQQEI